MNLKTIKDSVDAVANIAKLIEELDPKAKVLPDFQRSLQLDWYSCGAQSVFMILRYYQRRCTIERVKEELGTDWSGTNLKDIKRVFRKHGLTAHVIAKANLRDLRKAIDANHPALISTLEGEHWSVVYGYSPTHIYVCDPSLMVNVWCRISKSEFAEQWDRWCMVVRK